MLKVVFNTWAGAFFNPGGGEIQLLETQRHLSRSGVAVAAYDLWKPLREIDVFHQFSVQSGVEFPMREYRALGVKIACSTILWADLVDGTQEHSRIRAICDLADVLFTNSRAESLKLSKSLDLPIEKFHETRNGISDAYLNFDTTSDFRAQFEIEGDFLLSVANIDQRKNTHLLVEACKALGAQLVLVGHVRDVPYFEALVEQHSQFFKYLGPIVDVNLLKSAYQQARLFVLPSLCETPGIAALEAASQGCPIMITNEGCTEEYFGNYVTYVDPLSAASIRDGISVELAKQRDGALLSQHVKDNFTWSKAAKDVLAGYKKILGET